MPCRKSITSGLFVNRKVMNKFVMNKYHKPTSSLLFQSIQFPAISGLKLKIRSLYMTLEMSQAVSPSDVIEVEQAMFWTVPSTTYLLTNTVVLRQC